MKTIVLERPGQFKRIDAEQPGQPAAGEALVRVRRVGICGTDLHAFQGNQPFFAYPRILGHELAVEVAALGPSAAPHHLAIGDRCAVNPYLHCGHCNACRRGKTNCCANLQVLGVHCDGGMREYISVPIAKLHNVQSLPFEQLALVEMLCIGAHAVRRAQIEPNENVVVVGAGPIGLGVMRFAQLAGANVIGMEVSERRIAFARQHLGVEQWVDGRREPIAQLQNVLHGELPTTVLDATGNAQSMINAFNLVAHGGKLIFVGLFQGDVSFHDPDFHRRELTLLASRNATDADFDYVLSTLAAQKIDLAPWITHQLSPEHVIDEFAGLLDLESGVVKGMVVFD